MIDRQVLEGNACVEAAILFGSQARGDSDVFSDRDLAVFVHATNLSTLGQIKTELVSAAAGEDVSLSIYSVRTAEILARDGSLFLWHLNLEGKVLFERSQWVSLLFSTLNPYSADKTLQDIETFENILADVVDSLRRGDGTFLFEAATMYAVLRNSAMIYSYLTGIPCFGRSEPIARLATGMHDRFPFFQSEIRLLQTYRLMYTRVPSMTVEIPTPEWCITISSKMASVLQFVKENLHA